jgi:hypothetical protein
MRLWHLRLWLLLIHGCLNGPLFCLSPQLVQSKTQFTFVYHHYAQSNHNNKVTVKSVKFTLYTWDIFHLVKSSSPFSKSENGFKPSCDLTVDLIQILSIIQ